MPPLLLQQRAQRLAEARQETRQDRPSRERFEGKGRDRDNDNRRDKFDRNKGDRNKGGDRGSRDKGRDFGGRDKGGRDKRDQARRTVSGRPAQALASAIVRSIPIHRSPNWRR